MLGRDESDNWELDVPKWRLIRNLLYYKVFTIFPIHIIPYSLSFHRYKDIFRNAVEKIKERKKGKNKDFFFSPFDLPSNDSVFNEVEHDKTIIKKNNLTEG